jgi:hypothetical protein
MAKWIASNRDSVNKRRRERSGPARQRVLSQKRDRYKRHRNRIQEQMRDWKSKNKDRVRAAQERDMKKNYFKRKLGGYGLTETTFYALLSAQNGNCAICLEPVVIGGQKGVHIDHAHDSDEVRGLLCRGCNIGLGHFKDSPAVCEAAASYLRRHKTITRVA